MNPFDQLVEACASWRCWTEQEGEAITAGDWAKVDQCQAGKLQLQSEIDEHVRAVRAHAASDETASTEVQLQSAIAGLIVLEHRNNECLGRQRDLLSDQRSDLENATRNLRLLQHSYAGHRDSAWQSYS